MATGDAKDIAVRLRSVIPARWFPVTAAGEVTATPVLDAVLVGLGTAWATIYGALVYVKAQTRIATATDMNLDVISLDYFGAGLPRRSAEPDSAFRTRIQHELLRPRGTRAALVAALTDLTGRAPVIFEPSNTTDTGGLGYRGLTSGNFLALGVAATGGVGSLNFPFQCFVKAYRPIGQGIGILAGLGSNVAGLGAPLMALGSAQLAAGQVSDADIYATIAKTMPVSTVAWTQISS